MMTSGKPMRTRMAVLRAQREELEAARAARKPAPRVERARPAIPEPEVVFLKPEELTLWEKVKAVFSHRFGGRT